MKKKSCSPVYLGQFCQERITFCIFHMPHRRKMKGIYVKLSDIGIEYNLYHGAIKKQLITGLDFNQDQLLCK